MRISIDIPEDVRVAITRMGLLRIPDEMQNKVDEAIQRGTPIPDNVTVCDIEQIRDEIERLHYHPKLDFIKNDEVVEMALDIIDKYRVESEE